jgi:hypothetical protein
LQQMGRKRMPKRVRCRRLRYAGHLYRAPHAPLQILRIGMVATGCARTRSQQSPRGHARCGAACMPLGNDMRHNLRQYTSEQNKPPIAITTPAVESNNVYLSREKFVIHISSVARQINAIRQSLRRFCESAPSPFDVQGERHERPRS